MQDVLEFVLKNITTVPDDVKIDVEEQEGTTNYVVTVNPADVGRIIGKEGKVIKAIRTIMRVIAIQRGVHVRISVVSENDGRGEVLSPVDSEPTESSVASEPMAEESDAINVEV